MRLRRHLAARVVAAAALMMVFAAPAADGYRSLQITSPQDQATIHDNEGKLDVAVALVPPLDVRAGDRLQLAVDGKVVANAEVASFKLADVPRGAHIIEVDVRDRAERVLLRAAPVTVYLWHASRLFPNRAGR